MYLLQGNVQAELAYEQEEGKGVFTSQQCENRGKELDVPSFGSP